MKAKWIIPAVIIFLGILVIGIAYIQDIRFSTRAQMPQGWIFDLPEGDAIAGKEAFVKLECASCHNMNISGETQEVEKVDIGPDLTVGYHNLTEEYLAESIIKAHTVVADPTYVMKVDQAGMGKYNHFLTVKELTDLVAFLKQSPEVSMK